MWRLLTSRSSTPIPATAARRATTRQRTSGTTPDGLSSTPPASRRRLPHLRSGIRAHWSVPRGHAVEQCGRSDRESLGVSESVWAGRGALTDLRTSAVMPPHSTSHTAAYRRSMAYEPRDEPAGYHHVVTRGNNKRRSKTLRPLELLPDRRANRNEVTAGTILAYCLMGNHYHLVITARRERARRRDVRAEHRLRTAVQRLARPRSTICSGNATGTGTAADAKARERAALRDSEPGRAGGTRPLEAYRWASYAATIGLAFARIRLARDDLLAFFGTRPETALVEFRASCAPRSPRRPCPAAAAVNRRALWCYAGVTGAAAAFGRGEAASFGGDGSALDAVRRGELTSTVSSPSRLAYDS